MTLWLCPCLRPHLVALSDQIPGTRFRGYCERSHEELDLLLISKEDETPREYEPKRSLSRGHRD